MKKITAILCSLILLVLCGCAPAENTESSSEKSAPQSSGSLSSESISESTTESKAELPEASPALLYLLCTQGDEASGYIDAEKSVVVCGCGKEIPFPAEFAGTLGFGEVFPVFFIGEHYYYFAALDPQSGNPALYYVSKGGSAKNALDIHPDNLSASKTQLWLVSEDDGFILQEEDGGYSLYRFTEKGAATSKIHIFETGSATALSEMKFITAKIGFITAYSKASGGRRSAILYRTEDGGESWQETSLSLASYDVDYESSSASAPQFIKNFGILRLYVWSGDRNAAFSRREAFVWNTNPARDDISFSRYSGGSVIVFFSEDYGESWLPLFSELTSSASSEDLRGYVK